MKTPFSEAQFFEVIRNYNDAFFPVQIVLLLLGLAMGFLLHSKARGKDKVITLSLGILWLWIGIAYHFNQFTQINNAAWSFGAIFILQGIFFLIHGIFRDDLQYSLRKDLRGYLGYFFVLFGLIIYPVISYFLEGSFIQTISLGLPCPSTILTFGFFLLTVGSFPRYLLIIPTIWAIIGTGAAVNFGVYHDYVMILAAILTIAFIFRDQKRGKRESKA